MLAIVGFCSSDLFNNIRCLHVCNCQTSMLSGLCADCVVVPSEISHCHDTHFTVACAETKCGCILGVTVAECRSCMACTSSNDFAVQGIKAERVRTDEFSRHEYLNPQGVQALRSQRQ